MPQKFARLTLCALIILGVSLTAVPVQVRAQSATGGTVIADVNVRTGPGTGYSVITHLPIKTRVEIEGRTAANDWILLHTADSSTRGWAATYFVQLDPEFSWAPIPVSAEIIGGAPQAAGSGQAEPVPAEDNSGTVLASFLDEERARLQREQPTQVTIGDARREVQRWHWQHVVNWIHQQLLSGVTPDELHTLLVT